jgi:manganese/zinc/iron transport system permease protein
MFFNAVFSNPYHNQDFWGFFVQLFYRMWLLLTGQLPWDQLVADEIQIGVLAGVAASSALVGTYLILRRMTMLANSLSHTILMGIVLAYFFTMSNDPSHEHATYIPPMQAMLLASLIMGFITAFLTEFLTKTGQLQEDASMGLVFTSFFALGIVLVTVLTRDAHIGTEAVMGNADALMPSDLRWVYWILLVNIVLFCLLAKGFKLTTFDPQLALALGFSPLFFNYLLMAQVSATSITAFRAVGVLLVLAFMTGPPLAARLLTHRLFNMLTGGVIIGILCAIIGVALTRHILTVFGMALSTSGIVVCMILCFYIVIAVFAPERGLLSQILHKRKKKDVSEFKY